MGYICRLLHFVPKVPNWLCVCRHWVKFPCLGKHWGVWPPPSSHRPLLTSIGTQVGVRLGSGEGSKTPSLLLLGWIISSLHSSHASSLRWRWWNAPTPVHVGWSVCTCSSGVMWILSWWRVTQPRELLSHQSQIKRGVNSSKSMYVLMAEEVSDGMGGPLTTTWLFRVCGCLCFSLSHWDIREGEA